MDFNLCYLFLFYFRKKMKYAGKGQARTVGQIILHRPSIYLLIFSLFYFIPFSFLFYFTFIYYILLILFIF